MSDLEQIKERIADCKSYNFGMRNADKLAHEDAAHLTAAVEAVVELADHWAALAEGDRFYATRIRAAIENALNP